MFRFLELSLKSLAQQHASETTVLEKKKIDDPWELPASPSSQNSELQVQRETLPQKTRWRVIEKEILKLVSSLHIHAHTHICES